MTTEQEKNMLWDGTSGCPHYEAVLKRCLLSRGGIYVPVDDYVRQFCHSEQYTQCEIFLADGKMSCMFTPPPEQKGADRRRHRRVPERIPMTLALLQATAVEDTLLDDSAFTLDLSEGGMCLASHRELPVDSQISFRLGRGFRQDLLGIGQVRWCSSADDSPLFHAGMMFTDPQVSQAVGRYLALAA